MSQKSQKVFSRKSQPKEPTDQELKREIFANIPLSVFRNFTNVHSLIAEKHRQSHNGKEPTTFFMNRKTEEFHKGLSKMDVNDESLKNLKFVGSNADLNDAKIWLLSTREQNRIYNHSTKQQKKFLYLPQNVLLHATNFAELVRAAASEGGATQPDKFVDDIFKSLHQIDNWIPALSNLKFNAHPEAQSSNEIDIDPKPKGRSDAIKPIAPLGQKRTNRVISIDDDTMSEQSNSAPAKRRRSDRLQSKESVNDENYEHRGGNTQTKKESKIPLLDKKRKSRANEMVYRGPNDLQLEVQGLNVEDFVVKTNIKAIILDEYRNEVRDVNANIPEDELTNRLLAYNTKRMDNRQWNRTGLNKLKFIKPGEANQMSISTQPISSKASTSPTAVPTPSDKKTNDSQLNKDDKLQLKRPAKTIEPNDFQKEIMAMDYEKFVNETNAKELVRKHFQNKTEPMTDEAMETELKKLDEDRYHLRRYHKGLLNHLKILKCECQRHKTFHDKWTQTEVVQSQDANAQCDSVGGSTNEFAEPVQADRSLNSRQSKLKTLSVHEISESEIRFFIESVSSTFVADAAITSQTQAASPLNESPLPKDIETEFDSLGSPKSIEIPNDDIESILASMETDDIAEAHPNRVVDEQTETEFSETLTDDLIQPDPSANGMIMAEDPDLQDESEILPHSKVVDYIVECKVVSENIPGQCDTKQNSTAVDSLVNEASFIDSETPIESKDDENEHDSTQPAGISGETESNANVDAEMSIGPNDDSNVQEQNSTTSSDKENDSRLSQFEPKEISTPKSTNEAKHQEQRQQAPCQVKNEEKGKLSHARQNRAPNELEKVKKFFDGLRNKDPEAIGRLRELIFK